MKFVSSFRFTSAVRKRILLKFSKAKAAAGDFLNNLFEQRQASNQSLSSAAVSSKSIQAFSNWYSNGLFMILWIVQVSLVRWLNS